MSVRRPGHWLALAKPTDFILEQVRAILSKGLENGGKTYKVEIISKDSQSNGSRRGSGIQS